MTRQQLIEKYDLDLLMGPDCDPDHACLEYFVWEKLFYVGEVERAELIRDCREVQGKLENPMLRCVAILLGVVL